MFYFPLQSGVAMYCFKESINEEHFWKITLSFLIFHIFYSMFVFECKLVVAPCAILNFMETFVVCVDFSPSVEWYTKWL